VIKVSFVSPSGGGSPLTVSTGPREAMEAAAISSVVELLNGYGILVQPSTQGPPPLAALGLVRFTAQGLSGTATLGASASILKRSNSAGSGRDWIAELANQFVGRWKLKLLRGGFELWSMAPVAVKGRLLVTGISQPESPPFVFTEAQGGGLALWMDVEVTGEVGKMTSPAEELPREGDVILFD
jgi:hypothetical protein